MDNKEKAQRTYDCIQRKKARKQREAENMASDYVIRAMVKNVKRANKNKAIRMI